jgi:NAD-dependent SIR2 family protein deacetylase
MSNLDIYVIGAGSSISAGVPLTKHFVPYLFENEPQDERLVRVRDFIKEFYASNFESEPVTYPKFEQVLTMLDMAIDNDHYMSSKFHHKYLRQLRNDMVYLIWYFLGRVKNESRIKLYDSFVDKIDPDSSVLISLNYDTLLDFSIMERFSCIDYGIKFTKLYSDKRLTYDERPPLLLKIHGSINWLYCPNCESIYAYVGNECVRNIFNQQPELCVYDDCYLKGIIIPPTGQKNYELSPLSLMWIKAGKLLRSASRITFIGYSLNEIDMRVLYLLKRAHFNNKNKPAIRVVDPDPTGFIFQRYKRLFGEIEGLPITFDEFVKNHL